ncbi:MAG: pyridoxal phosphate-dependent decarboxylase family protein, partial [Planctomycetota bacterium]
MPSSDLKGAFDPESFRERGHRIVDRLAGHLAASLRDPAMPVLPWKDPEAMLAAWPGGFSRHGDGDLEELLDRFLEESQHLHHPRFVGHQVAVPLPETALAELAGRLANNGMAIYEMGPVLWAMERRVIGWMSAVLGLGEEAGGVLTSGGTLGNLHALLAARRFRAGHDTWEEGMAKGPPLAFLVPVAAHYSSERAGRSLGRGREGIVPVAVDEALRMKTSDLEPALRRAEAAGRKVLGVVANACCTPTGTFDPLGAVADFCDAHGLWMHVDGAHGACAALSPAHASRVAGIERADSVVW